MKKRIISLVVVIALVITMMPATVATSSAATNVTYTWPTDSRIVTGHWGLESGHYYPYHYGIDIGAAKGDNVYAAAPGKVIYAGWYGSYGRCVQIKHANGQVTLYAHNSKLITSNGATVKRGDVIAKVGGSGGDYSDNVYPAHLHFGIYQSTSSLSKEDGRAASKITLDPEKLLQSKYEKTYTIAYSDGISSTSYTEDAKIIPTQTAKSGKATATSKKKFTRTGYNYNSWYIFKLVDGKAHYWCRDKATGKTGKWIAYDGIPSTYRKTVISHGGKINFTVSDTTIYLTPAWKKNYYYLNYRDGLSSTKNDSKIIPRTKMISGEPSPMTTKKFQRTGYEYTHWYIYIVKNGKAHYWCRDKATGKTGKWIAYDSIPSTYYKVKINREGNIYFTVANKSNIYVKPVWVKK